MARRRNTDRGHSLHRHALTRGCAEDDRAADARARGHQAVGCAVISDVEEGDGGVRSGGRGKRNVGAGHRERWCGARPWRCSRPRPRSTRRRLRRPRSPAAFGPAAARHRPAAYRRCSFHPSQPMVSRQRPVARRRHPGRPPCLTAPCRTGAMPGRRDAGGRRAERGSDTPRHLWRGACPGAVIMMASCGSFLPAVRGLSGRRHGACSPLRDSRCRASISPTVTTCGTGSVEPRGRRM